MPPKPTTSTSAPSNRTGTSKPSHTGKSAKPKAPKAPRPASEQLQRHFTSLCAQIEGGHFANAIKSCDRILRLAPNDEDTLQTKLFLLLQTDQYTAAWDLLESSTPSSPLPASINSNFNRAYVLYRLHRGPEASEALGNLTDRGSQHLSAQLKVRDGDYHSARDIYNNLLDDSVADTDEYADVLANLENTQAHIDFLEKGYLTGVHALPTAQSASALEALPAPSIVSALSAVTNLQTAAASTSAARKVEAHATKAPRKSRVPKHVIPGTTPMPDPERWLKKRERTNIGRHYGKGRQKGAGMGVGSTQGAAVADPVPSASKGSGGGGSGGGGQQKQKGRKGK